MESMHTSPPDWPDDVDLPRSGREAEPGEDSFRLLVESVRDYAIFMLDPEGRVVTWNRGAERLKGYTEQEIVGRHFGLFHTAPDVEIGHPNAELEIARRVGRHQEEGWRVRKGGGLFRADVTLTAIRDPTGRLIGFAKVTRDVTERLAEEEERALLLKGERDARGEAERRAFQETALREAVLAVSSAFTVDETTRRIAASALAATRADGAFVEQVDIHEGDALVTAIAGEITPPVGSRIPFQGSYTQFVMEREKPEVILRLGDAPRELSGQLRELHPDCSAAVIPLLNAGEPIGSLVLIRSSENNIFREDEIERAFSYGHLASLAFRKIHMLEDSERKREELLRVTESRARLMRGFSHDVKNPLGAADGYLSLLEDGIEGEIAERQRESIGHARRLLRSALELIDDLLDLAHAEAGQLEVDLAPTDIREATREIAQEYSAQAQAEGLTIELEVPAEISIVESDPVRVRQVVGNLLSNAIKYNRPGGHIFIRVEEEDRVPEQGSHGWIRIAVRDTGHGIPDDQRSLLFQEFSRLTPAKQGSGIGLAMAQNVARALGGRISVESRVGEGSTFTIWLPLRRVGERRGSGR